MRRSAGEWGGAVLVFLAASTMAIANEEPAMRPDLIVLWSDPQRSVSDAVRRELVRETEALFERWGVRVGTSLEAYDGPRRPVRVVLLDQARFDGGGQRILGETHARPLEFPAVWIWVPNVRAMLERTEWGANPPVLARALARVAAHEILHVLAPGLGHASHGLMRAGLGARDLARHKVPVNSAFRRALLEAVSPAGRQATLGRP
jgi:hypothetical protein